MIEVLRFTAVAAIALEQSGQTDPGRRSCTRQPGGTLSSEELLELFDLDLCHIQKFLGLRSILLLEC
jgi:hypothetical protein